MCGSWLIPLSGHRLSQRFVRGKSSLVGVKGDYTMLRKIDCVLIYVQDLAEAANFYADVFGLKPLWQDQDRGQAGLLFPESETEIVLHTDSSIPGKVEVNYLVSDVHAAVLKYADQGCKILVQPFDIRTGKCAVIQDPFGTRLCILDLSKAVAEISQI